MAFNLSMNASEIDKTLVESRRLLDSDPATKQYVDEKATWEDMPDKPFGEQPTGGDTLTWDGDTTGRDVFEGVYFKVSDTTPTITDFSVGANLVLHNGASISLAATDCVDEGGAIVVGVYGFSVPNEVASDYGLSPGFYLRNDGNIYVASITIPGYTGFPSVKTIDEKFLPESVKGGSGGVVYVTVETNEDGTEITNCSMFFPEIKAAYEAGKAIMAVLPFGDDHTILPLTAVGASSGLVDFSATLVVSGYPYFYYARIGASTSDTSIGLAMLATTTP